MVGFLLLVLRSLAYIHITRKAIWIRTRETIKYMVSPQKENGYTAIANEILETLVKVRIPASEKDVMFFVIRKTYGFQKKEDRISLTQFTLGTGLSRVTVIKALKNLLSRNMLVKRGILFSFNKHYDSWVVNAGILVKSQNVFGKGGYTKTGKGGYTHKRKKKTKEIDIVFSSKENKDRTQVKDLLKAYKPTFL